MGTCKGRNLEKHCCWLKGEEVCPYLKENAEPGYRWSCGLFLELSSWDAVLADPRYTYVQDRLPAYINCKNYPDPAYNIVCATCGSDG